MKWPSRPSAYTAAFHSETAYTDRSQMLPMVQYWERRRGAEHCLPVTIDSGDRGALLASFDAVWDRQTEKELSLKLPRRKRKNVSTSPRS